MTVRSTVARILALAAALGAAAACGDVTGAGPTLAVTVASGTSDSIHLADPPLLGAIVRDGSGRVVPEPTVAWRSGDTAVADIDQASVFTDDSGSYARVLPVRPGTVTISAVGDHEAGSLRLTFVVGPLNGVAVLPATASIVVGERLRVTARVLDHRSSVVHCRAVVWASSEVGVATVADVPVPADSLALSAAATITAVAVGTARVTATLGDSVGTVVVSVVPPPPAVGSVSIVPSSVTVFRQYDAILAAEVRDPAGAPMTGVLLQWATLNPLVALVGRPCDSSLLCSTDSTTAHVRGSSLGTATITATAPNGVSGSATVTVVVGQGAPIAFWLTQETVRVGRADTVRAQASDTSGRLIDLASYDVRWEDGDTTVAGLEASGVLAVLSGRRAGATTVCASMLTFRSCVVQTVVDALPPDIVTTFAWLPDGRTVLYAGYPTDPRWASELWLRDLDGAQRRIAILGDDSARAVATAPDGSAFYAVLEGASAAARLVRVSGDGGPVVTLLDSVSTCWSAQDGGVDCTVLMAAPDGAHVLAQRPPDGALWSYDLVAGTGTRLAAGRPVAFAPDRRSVLVAGPAGAWTTVDLATGAATAVPGSYPNAADAAWDAQGVHLLGQDTVGDSVTLARVDLATGQRTVIVTKAKQAWDSTGFARKLLLPLLGPDLRTVAFVSEYFESFSTHYPAHCRYAARIASAATHAVVAGTPVGNGGVGLCGGAPDPTYASVGRAPLYSPDGRSILYLYLRKLGILAVP